MVENKRCILIADDEPKMVRALRDFFVANNFCVLEAKDGIVQRYPKSVGTIEWG